MSHLKKLQKKHLNPGETVLASADGYIGKAFGTGENAQKNGILAVTAERVIFYRSGFLGETIESIPLKSISSIERKSTLGYRGIRIHTSHDDLKFTTLDERAESAVCSAIEANRHEKKQPEPQATTPKPPAAPLARPGAKSPPVNDAGERLKQVNDLLAAGLISDADAEKKRAEILADV